MHNNFYRQMVFTRNVLRTEVLCTEGLRTTFFIYRRFYTQMPLHGRRIAHSTRLHATNFYTERFCFPFLITYLSCSPSQVYVYTNTRTHTQKHMACMQYVCCIYPCVSATNKSQPQYLNIQYIYISILMHANAVRR